MKLNVAEVRRRFKEVLDHVGAGHVVQVTRRGRVVAVVSPPSTPTAGKGSFGESLHAWRQDWDVSSWPDDDVFGDVRDTAPGRSVPW